MPYQVWDDTTDVFGSWSSGRAFGSNLVHPSRLGRTADDHDLTSQEP